jgi:glycosyltransferase involved in cell wall biosynthesis
MPKISIIVPNFNGEKFILNSINSVLNQTYKDIEIIVVDDGSTDKSREIISAFPSPVKLVTQANAGVSAARNRGLREAKGEYICFLDNDDYWFPGKLARQLEEFEKHPEVGIVYSSFIRWSPEPDGSYCDPESIDLSSYSDDIDPIYSGWIYHQLLLDCWIFTSTTMFRAEVFERCGVFNETLPLGEDWVLWLIIAREYPVIMLIRPTTLYRQHPQQTTSAVRNIDYRSNLLIENERKWGLCSKDGRCLTKQQFNSRLSSYQANFGLQHLQIRNTKIAINSFIKAWIRSPLHLKYLAYFFASLLGWRPNY